MLQGRGGAEVGFGLPCVVNVSLHLEGSLPVDVGLLRRCDVRGGLRSEGEGGPMPGGAGPQPGPAPTAHRPDSADEKHRGNA